MFFYDSRLYLLCLGAFSIFFLSVKSLHELERPARTFYTDPWSIFTSNESFEKAKRTCCFSRLCSCRWKEGGPWIAFFFSFFFFLLFFSCRSQLDKTRLIWSGLSLQIWKLRSPCALIVRPWRHSCWDECEKVSSLPPSTRRRLWSLQYMDFHLCLPDSFSPHQHLF